MGLLLVLNIYPYVAYAIISPMIKAKNNSQAFTIVELLIIVAVIGILAAITVVSYRSVTENSNKQAVKTDIVSVASNLTKYKAENGKYPASLADVSGGSLDSTFEYNYSASTDTYCLIGSKKGYSTYVKSGNSAPKEGTCTLPTGPQITNRAVDPNATATANFSAGTGGSLQRRTDGGYNGSTYIRRTATTANSTGITLSSSVSSHIPVEQGKTYSFSVWVRSNKPTPQYLYVGWLNSSLAGTGVISSGGGQTVGTNWTLLTYTVVAPAGDVGFSSTPAYASISVRPGTSFMASSPWVVGDYQDIDGIMATEGPDTYDFMDGTFPGCSWQGTANASATNCQL